jgi:biotin carboxyl carrier protein
VAPEYAVATHRLVIEGKEFTVAVGSRSGNQVEVSVNGKTYDVEIAGGRPTAVVPRASAPIAATPAAPPRPEHAAGAATSGEVRAPIAGLVMRVSVAPGQQVSAGTEVVVLEAMKMENQIFAPAAGVVESVAVRADQQVNEGALLVTLKLS